MLVLVRTMSQFEVDAGLRNAMAEQRPGDADRRPPRFVLPSQSRLAFTPPEGPIMPPTRPAIVSEQVRTLALWLPRRWRGAGRS